MVVRISLGLLVLMLGLVACSSANTAGTPAPPATSSSAPVADPPPADTLTAYTEKEVQALFDARCVRCHDAKSANLDLSEPFTMTTIGIKTGGTRGTVCSRSSDFRVRIKPGDRDGSLLWHKVKGTQDCGRPMPYEQGDTKLDDTELERLGLYIDSLE